MSVNKSICVVFAFIVCSLNSFAQNGINYKAIIKDNLGNVVANSVIQVQFKIIQGTGASQTNVYEESHSPTTDINGVLIVNIGEGSVTSGDFITIDWGNNEHFLNVQIDTGTGLVDLGTTQFKSVPYALQAETATNVTGLEAVNDGNGIGWRFKGNTGSGNIGFGSVELSNSTSTASGGTSLAGGILNTASGDGSLVFGSGNQATAIRTTAFGEGNVASGNNATVFGTQTNANSYSSFTVGRGNIGGGDPVNWIETNPLFEIGNGESNSDRSNALTVLKNGTITAPSFDLTEITDDKALITKEYADTNLISSGLEALDEGNGLGWRLKGANPNNYGDIGLQAIDLSYSESASSANGATGDYSTAIGFSSFASGFGSTAIGIGVVASGDASIALGTLNIDNPSALLTVGNGSLLFGASNALTILQNGKHIINSTDTGLEINTPGFNGILINTPSNIGLEVASAGFDAVLISNAGNNGVNVNLAGNFGGFFRGAESGIHAESSINGKPDIILGGTSNTAFGDDGIIVSDPLYGGSDMFLKSNDDIILNINQNNSNISTAAFSVTTGVSSNPILNASANRRIGVNGLANSDLHIFHSNSGASGGIKLENDSDGSWWRLYVSSGSDDLRLYSKNNGNTSAIGNFNDVSGAYSALSDRRLKNNIESLAQVLDKVEALNVVSYRFNNQKNNAKHVGFIAQDVEKIFPHLVVKPDPSGDNGNYTMDYSGFGVLAIKAIQEQQEKIKSLENKVNSLMKRLEALEKN